MTTAAQLDEVVNHVLMTAAHPDEGVLMTAAHPDEVVNHVLGRTKVDHLVTTLHPLEGIMGVVEGGVVVVAGEVVTEATEVVVARTTFKLRVM